MGRLHRLDDQLNIHRQDKGRLLWTEAVFYGFRDSGLQREDVQHGHIDEKPLSL